MTCQEYDHQLGDYVDGTLDVTVHASVEAHLGTCDRCRALVADFRTIRFASLAMEPALPPPSVWPALAARFEAETAPWWHFGGSGLWRPVAALGMAVLLTTALTVLGANLSSGGDAPRLAGGAAPAPLTNVALDSSELDSAEKDYATAIAGLEQITTAERDALDPGTADVLKVNLTAIDTAIGESRAVLRTEPENDLAIESLFEALRRKLALLQDAVALINEMRKGNSEGAARIVSGRNQ